MKKESSGKKSLLWLWITIAVVVVAAVAVALVFILGGIGNDKNEGKIYSEIYWNVDRESVQDPETGLSLREPAEDGVYYIRFAVGGEQVELPIADAKLSNKIDVYDALCLEINADGVVVDAAPAKEVYTVIAENAIVQNIDGESYLLNSSIAFNGMETTLNIGEDVGVYNVVRSRPEVPGRLFKTGELGTLEVMDTITIYGKDEKTPTDIFISGRPYASKVYWRAEPGQYDAANKRSKRERAEDGFWYVDFLVDGKVETYRTNVQAVINALDGYGTISCACSLIFDQEGNVVDCASASYAIRGKVAANNYNVSTLSADGKSFTATRLIAGNEAGRTYTSVIGEDTKIYNVNSTADYLGQEDTLQEGDLLYVLADPMGNAKVIFITNRYVDSPMYYNTSVKYNSKTKESTRTPDASGWYTFDLAVKGQLKKFRCNNKAIVNQIDAAPNSCMGLKVSGDVILKYYDPNCVAGNWSFGSGYFVTSADGVILSVENTAGTVLNGVMRDDCEIYDVSGHSEFKGVKTTLREGDRIVGYKNPQGEVTHVYTIARYEAGTSLYWNVNRNTSRKPDADGWYVYKMIKMGKTGFVTVKTDNAKIAKQIDTYNPAAMTLRVNSQGVVTKVYNSNAFTIGYEHLSGIHAIGYNAETERWLLKYRTTGAEANCNMSDVEIYNFSGVYDKAPGERTTLRPGDRIETIYDSHGKMKYAWVYEREHDSNAYWLKDPKTIDAKTGYTSREKAADGYYYFTVAVNGTTKVVKTDDIDIATAVDGTVKNNLCLAFGLKLDGDVIKAVLSAGSVKGIYVSGQSYYDVTAINGNTVTLERLKPGSSNTGDKQVINISKAKIYEVSQYAGDKFGKETKLTIGDRVQTYIGEDSETITYVFVAFHNTHEAGAFSYCEHCGKEVFWEPYTTNVAVAYIKDYSYHYYLPADCGRQLSTGWGATGGNTPYDWVLDLNGFTYRATDSYAFAVRGSSTLTVLDTSKAKTGAITGVGVQIKDKDGNVSKYQSSSAGIFRVLDNGVLNLRGGTYTRTVDREITNLRRGGVAVIEKDNKTGRFGTLNIYDGAKLVNNTMDAPLDLTTSKPQVETRRAPQGGAIYNVGGVVNIYGGEIANNGKIHDDYKEFANTAVGNGGNIFNADGELNIYGGKITGGWCVGNGGNIYVTKGKLNIAGGEISGGTSINGANNIIVAANNKTEVTISGGKVTGDVTISTGNTLKISGKPQITMGEKQGLFLGEGVKAEVGEMKDGAKIVLSSTGVFTTDFSSAAAAKAVLDKNYFVAASADIPFFVQGKALACGKPMCLNGHSTEAECKAAKCDKELLYWSAWTSKTSLPTSGNYFLTNNVTVDIRTDLAGNLNLDLNGFTVTRTIKADAANFGVYNATNGSLYMTDLSADAKGTVKTVFDTGVETVTGGGFLGYIAAGRTLTIDKGTYDFRTITTTSESGAGCAPVLADGNVVVNGGTFYGITASKGYGGIIFARSNSVTTINGGTFYGGKVYQGGMFAGTGKIIVNDGTFNGNNGADNKIIDATLPRTEVSHGGIFLVRNNVNAYLEINGGTFIAPLTGTSGGIIYVEAGDGVVKVNGGTYQLAKAGNGGFIRFRGKSLDITGVTLEGSTAATGDIIAFNSTGTLTIGKDAVIDGGIQMVPVNAKSGKIVLKDNVKINAGTNYAIKLDGATMDISGLNDQAKVYVTYTDTTKAFAEAKDEATAKKLVDNEIIVSANGMYTVYADGKALKVTDVVDWKDWTSDNSLPTSGKYHLTKNVTIDARVNLAGDLVLDLNGFTVTRVIKADAADFGVYNATAGNLQITDLSAEAKGTVTAVFDEGVTSVTGGGFLGYVAAGRTLTIDKGTYDFRTMVTTSEAAAGCGPILADGNVVINDGTFFGISAAKGFGGVLFARSNSVVTINGGTFYGGKVYQGGMFAGTGKIIVNDGTFNGNNGADNKIIDATLPRTEVSHGGIFLVRNNVNAYLEINGGTFIAPLTGTSGGIIYVEAGDGVVEINGGTFQLAKAGNGGFIRFRGKTLDITGVTLEGATAPTGDIIAFNSTGTLTIGKDAVIDGGIQMVSAGKIVLKDNVKINAGTNYAIKLIDGVTLDLNGLNNEAKVYVTYTDTTKAFAEVADAAIAENLVDNEIVLNTDGNYSVYADGNALKVTDQVVQKKWKDATSLPTSGKYILNTDVTIDARVGLTGDLELDLNGFNITRVIKADATDYGVYTTNGQGNLQITDLSGGTVGTVSAVFDTDVTTCSGTGFLLYVGAGYTATIDNGIYDFRGVKTTNAAATGCGPIVADGNVVINGGTFYGTTAASGYGALFSGRSASTLTVNGGTFIGGAANQGGILYSAGKIVVNDGTLIGGSATRGGLIFTKDLEITGGMFDGNNNGADGKIDTNYPASVVGAHAGLIRANGTVTISGGTFQNGYSKNAAGILWAEGAASNVTITGGTFQNSKCGTTGGLMRLDGTATITGATLKGGTAGTLGSAIAFCSNKTLTIGQDAVIEGGVETRQYTGETDTKIVLKDNVQILADTNGKGVLLVDTTLDISGLNDEAKIYINHTDATKAFAEAADEATAKKLVDNKIIVSADPAYKVIADGKKLTVKVQIQWNEWNAAAAATALGGAEADNLHLKNLPTTGDWKLTANVTIDARVAMTGNLNLNLNGCTVTRIIKSGAADYGFYTTNAKGNLYITDEIKDTNPDATVGTMKTVFDTGVTTCAGTGFLGYVGAGYTITIDEGNFDFRGVKTTASAATGCGAIIVDGTLVINGGTFYGCNAGSTGYGTVISGRTAAVITINGGTFYGNNAKYGGIISTRNNLTINGGTFDGNTNSSNGKVNADLPQTWVTHGGLFYVEKNLTITDGIFKAARLSGSGGIAYVIGTSAGSTISGGTYTAGGTANYGGFFRFDNSATITGVTLSGGNATTNGNNVSFCAANGTLTIGQDAVIDGGIMFRTDKTGNKLVLVGNAKVNSTDAAKYSLKLANTTVHIGAATNAAVATVGATFTDYVATYDASENVTGVQ